MLETYGAIVDFSHVLSIDDPVVRAVMDDEIVTRLGAMRYRELRLTPAVIVLLFDKTVSHRMSEALTSLERDLDVSHSGHVAWKRYDLHSELGQFRADCHNAVLASGAGGREDVVFRSDSERLGTLLHVIDAMRTFDLSSYICEQPIVRYTEQDDPVHEFKEVWVDLDGIERAIGVVIRNDPWRFAHVTEFLDFKILDRVTRTWPGDEAMSLNMHTSHVLESQFDDLAFKVDPAVRNRLIFELALSDYIRGRDDFLAAVKKLRGAGFRVAADSAVWPAVERLDNNFPDVQFVKVPWSDAFQRLSVEQADKVRKLVTSSPGIEFVLNRCGRPEDVDIGRKLGFKLFQGWGVRGGKMRGGAAAAA